MKINSRRAVRGITFQRAFIYFYLIFLSSASIIKKSVKNVEDFSHYVILIQFPVNITHAQCDEILVFKWERGKILLDRNFWKNNIEAMETTMFLASLLALTMILKEGL